MTLQNEHLLIADLKKGSKEAFDEIYRLYAGRLLAYCAQYTKCREDAEEIVQDVFVALWNSRQTIRQEETLRSLLFTISKHRVINAYRVSRLSPTMARQIRNMQIEAYLLPPAEAYKKSLWLALGQGVKTKPGDVYALAPYEAELEDAFLNPRFLIMGTPVLLDF